VSKRVERKLIALVICFLFVMVSFLSFAYVVEHKEHDCVGNECSVCIQIQAIESLFEQFVSVGVISIAVGVGLLFFAVSIKGLISVYNSKSPIFMKVRMNN